MSNQSSPHVCSACPATYAISVAGKLDRSWSQRLAGMHIELSERNGAAVSTLVGQLPDQPALLGVLNALCTLGLPLLSVAMLQDEMEKTHGAS